MATVRSSNAKGRPNPTSEEQTMIPQSTLADLAAELADTGGIAAAGMRITNRGGHHVAIPGSPAPEVPESASAREQDARTKIFRLDGEEVDPGAEILGFITSNAFGGTDTVSDSAVANWVQLAYAKQTEQGKRVLSYRLERQALVLDGHVWTVDRRGRTVLNTGALRTVDGGGKVLSEQGGIEVASPVSGMTEVWPVLVNERGWPVSTFFQRPTDCTVYHFLTLRGTVHADNGKGGLVLVTQHGKDDPVLEGYDEECTTAFWRRLAPRNGYAPSYTATINADSIVAYAVMAKPEVILRQAARMAACARFSTAHLRAEWRPVEEAPGFTEDDGVRISQGF